MGRNGKNDSSLRAENACGLIKTIKGQGMAHARTQKGTEGTLTVSEQVQKQTQMAAVPSMGEAVSPAGILEDRGGQGPRSYVSQDKLGPARERGAEPQNLETWRQVWTEGPQPHCKHEAVPRSPPSEGRTCTAGGMRKRTGQMQRPLGTTFCRNPATPVLRLPTWARPAGELRSGGFQQRVSLGRWVRSRQ